MTHDLQTLIDKLNPVCRKGMEKAAELCVSQTHYNVEVEHYLLALLDLPETDLVHLFPHYDIRPEDAIRELRRFIERFRRGNTRTPALSPHILRLLEQSWMLSSLHFDAERIRSGAMLLALLETEALRTVVFEAAPVLKRFPRGRMKEEIGELLAETPEAEPRAGNVEPGDSAEPSKTPHLDRYTLDLTERARTGLIDPILGRDAEIRQLIDILTRRRQNNPILTGDAGVGKTAVVEGFALRIARGDVPPGLKSISLRLLDLGLLQAGAGVKGEFEKRLKAVVDEVRTSPAPVILFIDEAHTMIGAGGGAGMGDAANLLKPALARGELRTIAATTWAEYKKYFEKDPALARRFQVVKVEEPDEAAAAEMLRGVAANLEAHHGVVILDEAVRDAVRLSHRYITGRQLPDKAIGVLDTACARVALGQNATPPEIEELIRQIDRAETELGLLHREQAVGHDHRERIEALESELARTREARKRLEDRWKKERTLADRVIALEKKITAGCGPGRTACSPTGAAEAQKLADLKAKLAEVQGNAPMVPAAVDGAAVARVISGWTGIPAGRMMTDEIGAVLQMKSLLSERILGQPEALDAICRRIRTYRAHLDDPSRPVGAFLLVGPSGVGKTETALALADILYGGERNLTVINMSEYQEAYTVSGLKGSPPGYVGHGKGGVLTEAVRRRPYGVVLLDEVEKAHPDVMELFYQVFDKGTLEDSEGVPVDFRNTILLLTSNVASEILLERCANPRNRPSAELVLDWIRPELQNHFRPAFLGRLVVAPYFPLDVDTIREIVELQMRKIQARFLENHRLPLTYSDELAAEIAMRCTRADTGARNVDNILTHHLLPDLSAELLRRMAEGRPGAAVHVGMDGAGDFVYHFNEIDSAGGKRTLEPAAPSVSERPPEPQPAVPRAREKSEPEPVASNVAEKPPKPEPAEPAPVSVEEWREAQRESLPEFLRKPLRRPGGKFGGKNGGEAEGRIDEKIGDAFPSSPPREEDAVESPHQPLFRETDSEPGEVDPEFGGTVPRFFIEGPQNEADDDEIPEPRPKRRQGRGWLRTLFRR
ncbi:MAG: type VI secretion system ATPase TssH [Desulfococcaceae bacterium]